MPWRMVSSVAMVAGEADRVAHDGRAAAAVARTAAMPCAAAPRCRRRTPPPWSASRSVVFSRAARRRSRRPTTARPTHSDTRWGASSASGRRSASRDVASGRAIRRGGGEPQPGERGAHRRALGELARRRRRWWGPRRRASATCTGASNELTRVSTAIVDGASATRPRPLPPPARWCRQRVAVGCRRPRSRRARSLSARITLATRRRLWRSSVSAARTMPAGQR